MCVLMEPSKWRRIGREGGGRVSESGWCWRVEGVRVPHHTAAHQLCHKSVIRHNVCAFYYIAYFAILSTGSPGEHARVCARLLTAQI